MARERAPQLAYSELAEAMLDEPARRQKAAKILSVLKHFLGRDDLSGLVVADIGCSAGYIADELARAGAAVTIGVDIDVPGLLKAQARFGQTVDFVCALGERLPFRDNSIDVLVFNHIYEHVVDPEAVLADLHRVLKPGGALYLGLANRLGVMEPHYRLPFLSYLPGPLADRYVRAFGRAPHYHERFRTRPGLRRLLGNFSVWDYTFPVISHPEQFASGDMVGGRVSSLPPAILKAALPMIPTYIWVASKDASRPAGRALRVPPKPVRAG